MAIMRNLIVALSLALCVDAGRPVRPKFEPFMEGMDKPMEQNGRRLRSTIDATHSGTGRRLKFEYDGILADGVTTMNIDDMQEILQVSCGQDVLELEIDTAENNVALMKKITEVSTKLVITGRSEWGCHIMHAVAGAQVGKTSNQLLLRTSKAGINDIFQDLQLSMTAPITPRKSTTTKVFEVPESTEVQVPESIETEAEELESAETANYDAEEDDPGNHDGDEDLQEYEGDEHVATPRKLWGWRRRWFKAVTSAVSSVAHTVSHAVEDVAKHTADDVHYVAHVATHVVKTAVNVAEEGVSALAGHMNTDQSIPVPGANSIRWNADMDDNVIDASISFGDFNGAPACKDCYFYVDVDVKIQMQISDYSLDLLECTLDGSLHGQVSLQGTVQGDNFHYSKTLKTIDLPNIRFFVGAVPFEISNSLPISVGADLTFTGTQGSENYDLKAWASGSILRGIKIDSNGENPVNTVDYSYGYNIQGVPQHGAIVATAYLMPAIATSVTLLGGPIKLAEKVALVATIHGSGESSETCNTGSDHVTLSLEMLTMLIPSININLGGFSIYKESWPSDVIYQETHPLSSGCVAMSYSSSSQSPSPSSPSPSPWSPSPTPSPSPWPWRRLAQTKIGDHGTNAAVIKPSKLDNGKSPIGTGTTFHAVILPSNSTSNCMLDPTIRMSCVLHSEVDPHNKSTQEELVTGSMPLEFGCTQHRTWTKNSPNGTGNASKTVQISEFYQMKYVLENQKLKPLVSSQYCEDNPVNKTLSLSNASNTTENRSNPCYIYVSNGRGKSTIPKSIGDLTFNAMLDYDGITLTSDGSTTGCFILPKQMIRHTESPTTGVKAKCDSFACGTSAPINKGRGTKCSGSIDTCSAATCCKVLGSDEKAVSKVMMKLRMASLDYSKVTGNSVIGLAVVQKVTDAVVARMGANYSESNVAVTLSPGSVYAVITITPPSGIDTSDARATAAVEISNIASEVTTQVKTISNIESVTTTGDAADISVVVASTPVLTHVAIKDTTNSTSNGETTSGASSTSKIIALVFSTFCVLLATLSVTSN